MKFTELKDEQECKMFRLADVDKSFVNALRRTLIGNIPIIVCNTLDCRILTNTSGFTNEFISARLACIPIHHKVIKDSFKISVHVKNTTSKTIHVTTDDFKHEGTEKLYPRTSLMDGKYSKPIEFLRLRPDEEIELECVTSIANGTMSGMYNSVGICSYGCTHDKAASDAAWVKNPLADIDKANWDLLKAKRYVIPNSFDFRMRTLGVYTNEVLLKYAVIILKAQFEYCKKTLTCIESTTTIKNCFDVTITGDYTIESNTFNMNGDYSIGGMLEHQLYLKLNDPITYIAYYKKHPRDTYGILRVAMEDGTSDSILNLVHKSCDECIKQLDKFSSMVK